MSIRWDSVLVRAVAAELEDRLVGSRLRALYFDHAARTALLYFREATLVFRLHPERGDVSLQEPWEPVADARPLPARLRSVSARPDDRALRLRFHRVRGRPARLSVVVELMTNQWNALVLEDETGVIRHALWSREAGGRSLRSGARYVPPAASEREGAQEPISLARWQEILGSAPAGEERRVLLHHMAYASRLNAPALLPPSGGSAADAGAHLERGYEAWRRLRDGEPRDAWLLDTPLGLQPYPSPLPQLGGRRCETLLDAFGQAAEAIDTARGAQAAAVPSDLLDTVEAAARRARRRVAELERQRERARDGTAARQIGDLLLARLAEVPAGVSTAVLIDFDNEPVTVELDPALSATDNAQAYYRKASRAKRAAERIPALLDEAVADVERLDQLLLRIRSGEASEEEILAAVPARSTAEKGRDAGPALPYRAYRSSGGLEIRVGRGARWNDDLTFHHSAPNDVWLHARHAAGAHVILRWSAPESPPARDLEEAAVLAALASRARTSGTVPVDWTRRKYVRKPRKAPRGAVTLDRVKTLFVTPDPELEARLAAGPVDR
jgi:predicted ribosome quality control (RQC) complex YloA/Tae2 family protein